nr:sulfotransferase domain-containing protein [Bradyrhizobium diazoefficiens]
MLLWLASYPRSGNTFVRVLLKQVYGISTYDLHEPNPDRPEYEAIIGNATLDTPLPVLDRDDCYHIVKSHNLPEEDYPAIYLVRDGRDALVSYARFVLPKQQAEDRDEYLKLLRHLIETTGSYGGWSGNVRAWMARRTPTVVVRFDDLVERPLDELRRALATIGMRAPEKNVGDLPRFADLQKLGPHFFRKGRTGAWREEMPDDLHRLFWLRHGETMRALGYLDAEPAPAELAGKPIAAGERVTLGSGGGNSVMLGPGWGEREEWGTWSVGRRALLRLVIPRGSAAPVDIDLGYRSFIEGGRALNVTCRAAGQVISSWTCTPAEWRGTRAIHIPPEAVNAEGIVNLEFEMSEPKSPADLGLGQDTRELGIGIEFIRLARP